jgi:uncharacterized membrane protein HdeD (DUF308 family)
MSPEIEKKLEPELHHLRSSWLWFLLLGIVLVICGVVAISYPVITTISFVEVLGALLVIGGVVNVISAFWAGKWSGFMLELLVGILYVVLGMMINDRPGEAAVILTMLVTGFFMVTGLFRILAAMIVRMPQWGWFLLNGIVTLLCGVIIYRHPGSGLMLIGLLVGLELLFHGWTWIMLSLSLKRIKEF